MSFEKPGALGKYPVKTRPGWLCFNPASVILTLKGT